MRVSSLLFYLGEEGGEGWKRYYLGGRTCACFEARSTRIERGSSRQEKRQYK